MKKACICERYISIELFVNFAQRSHINHNNTINAEQIESEQKSAEKDCR